MASDANLTAVLADTAEKLQLHSLLMALEAARSGALGFAVVADETRNLSEATRRLLAEEPSEERARILAGQIRLLAQNAYLEGFRARLHLGEAAAAPLILVSQIEEAGDRVTAAAGAPLRAEALDLTLPPAENAATAPVEAMVFRCGRHLVGVEIDRVHEIAELHRRDLEAPENAPSFVVGLKTREGRLLPVLDTELLLDAAELRPGAKEDEDGDAEAARIVLIKLGDRSFGLLGDEVLGFVGLVPQQGDDDVNEPSARAHLHVQAGRIAFPRWNLVTDLRALEHFAMELEGTLATEG